MNLPLTFCAAWPNEFGDQTLQPPKQFAGMGETQPIFPKITKSLLCRVQVFIFSQSFLFHHCQGICFCRRGNKNSTYRYFPTQTHLLAREPLWWPQNLTKENPNQVYYWASSINLQLGAAECSWSGNKSALSFIYHKSI